MSGLQQVKDEIAFANTVRDSTTMRAITSIVNDNKANNNEKVGLVYDVISSHMRSMTNWRGE